MSGVRLKYISDREAAETLFTLAVLRHCNLDQANKILIRYNEICKQSDVILARLGKVKEQP